MSAKGKVFVGAEAGTASFKAICASLHVNSEVSMVKDALSQVCIPNSTTQESSEGPSFPPSLDPLLIVIYPEAQPKTRPG